MRAQNRANKSARFKRLTIELAELPPSARSGIHTTHRVASLGIRNWVRHRRAAGARKPPKKERHPGEFICKDVEHR